jgi:ubiquinone/menaquinone biosynthesis C-methylase UbiE
MDAAQGNFHLKEEIRAYWSERSKTFDQDFGHGIKSDAEFRAWQAPIRAALGTEPRRVLELACGTGEVTRLIHDLGHDVTALDFSEAMLSLARAKHAGKPRLRFILADAENTMEPDGIYDAIVCRHLVWTLTDPDRAFAEWHRVLKPGGKLVIFDGDWAQQTTLGRWATKAIALYDRLNGGPPKSDPTLSGRHAAIMNQLPFGDGLRFEMLSPRLAAAGFTGMEKASHSPIAKAQRRTASLRDRLRTLVYSRFILTATKA